MLALREAVFSFEQKCTLPDLDDIDKRAVHAAGITNHTVCMTARIVPPIVYQSNVVSFGRLAVRKNCRKKLGYTMVKHLMLYIDQHFPHAALKISAQAYLAPFDEKFGFKSVGSIYHEAGILHIKMCYDQVLIINSVQGETRGNENSKENNWHIG
jgi:ElaA protein